MSAPLTLSRLSREEFKDAPGWIDRLLGWLNQFLEQVAFALNGNLTFGQNVQAQVKAFDLVAGAAPANNTLTFTTTLKVFPKLLLVGSVVQRSGNYVPITAAVSVFWRYDNGVVYVTSITGLTAGLTYDFVVLLA
jgi:hypothetical protein